MKNGVDFLVTQVAPGTTRISPLTDAAREWVHDRAMCDSLDCFLHQQVNSVVGLLIADGFHVANTKHGVH